MIIESEGESGYQQKCPLPIVILMIPSDLELRLAVQGLQQSIL
jgi:hypothetical protein